VKIEELVQKIQDARSASDGDRALLVGISGIDASGKGHIAKEVADGLKAAGHRVALINIDGWLNLPEERFLSGPPSKPAGTLTAAPGDVSVPGSTPDGRHFYENALRLDDAFSQLVVPLKHNRSIDLTIDYVAETATQFRPYRYSFSNIDLILLEGIFIFKRAFARHFDLKIWIECSFETALERAIARGQEALSADETGVAYRTIYFPSQAVHFTTDDPEGQADVIFLNDEKRRRDPRMISTP
jgi:uridine kinase